MKYGRDGSNAQKGREEKATPQKKEDWRTKLKFTEMQFISVKFQKMLFIIFYIS